MLKTVLLSLAAVIVIGIAVVLALAAMKPDMFSLQRSLTINAPPERIFPLVNDLRRHGEWSPWEKKDPAMARSFSGAESGVGAAYEWKSDKEVGHGRMKITETTPPTKVVLDLDFTKPFEAHNVVTFTLEPRGTATNVTWAMTGATPFVAKIFHVFMNMDRMVGGEFETGLANLKAQAER